MWLRDLIRRLAFGNELGEKNLFIELESIVGVRGQHWVFRVRDDYLSIPSISFELEEADIDRALIIASGPSVLSTLSFERHDKEAYFAVNGAARFLDGFAGSRRYLVICDAAFTRQNAALVLDRLDQGVVLLTTPDCLLTLIRCGPGIVDHFDGVRLFQTVGDPYGCPFATESELRENGLFLRSTDDRSLRVGWSARADLGVYSGATVAFPALQIAVGMLAKEIEFHGLDLSTQGRAYDEVAPEPSMIGEHLGKYIKPAFELAGKHLKGTGVKVRNKSPDCSIEFAEIFDQ